MFETLVFSLTIPQTGRSEIVDDRPAPVRYGNYPGFAVIRYLVPIEASISGLPRVQYVPIDGSIDENGELVTPGEKTYLLRARIVIEDEA